MTDFDIIVVVLRDNFLKGDRGYKKQETKHQSVLCFDTELKAIFEMDKIDRKTLGWGVIH